MRSRLSLLRGMGLLVLLLLAVLLDRAVVAPPAIAAPDEPAATVVEGTITTDTTWTPEGSPYVLQTQNVTVSDGVTLTIEPGVTVELNAGRSLLVNGTLAAVGSPTQTITFTRMVGATSAWGTVQLGGGSVPTDSNASRVSYATIEGGGLNGQMLYVYRSAPTLGHVTLRNSTTRCLTAASVPADSALTWDTGTVTGCGWEGVYVTSGRAVLSGLTVSGNTGDGVELYASAHDSQVLDSTVQSNDGHGISVVGSSRLLLEGLTIAGNTGYGITMQSDGAGGGVGCVVRDSTVQGNAVAARLHPDTELDNVTWTGNTRSEIEWISGQIYGSRTWRRLPEISTYRVLGDIMVRDAAKLNVEPGVTAQFVEYASLKALGGLRAIGTPSQPITFTLLPGAANPWGMLEIGGAGESSQSDDSRISYATIEGGGAPTMGRLVHLYYTSAVLDHVTVRDSGSIGIQVIPFAGTQVTLDTVAVTGSAGVAIYHPQPGPSLVYRNLTLQGNGTDVVSIAGGSSILSPYQWDLAEAGVPVRVGTLSMYAGGALALMPGTRLEFTGTTGIEVWMNSGFYALGTPQAPVTLTGALPQAGAWEGVTLLPQSSSILRNCAIEYAGAGGQPGLKIQSPKSAIISVCAVRHAAGDGVNVDTVAPPVLGFNEISGNGFGVRNVRPTVPVDARQVWWGDVTGPQHPTLNPGGLGNAVSDGVLFDPWLTGVPTGSVALEELIVRVAGPRAVSPGESAVFGATYFNGTGQEIPDAVLVLLLPTEGALVEAYPASNGTGRGSYWAARHHVYWRLGTVPAGAGGMVAMRVHFPWGLPSHADSVMAMMGGADEGLTASSTQGGIWATFDILAYQGHRAVTILSAAAMTPAEVDAERQSSPTLDDFYQEGLAQGFVFASALRAQLSNLTPMVDITLNRPDGSATMDIVRAGEAVQVFVVDGATSTLRTLIGDMIYDRATNAFSFTGGLGAMAQAATDAAASDAAAVGGLPWPPQWPEPMGSAVVEGYPTYADCLKNCLYEMAEAMVVDGFIRRVRGEPPLQPEDIEKLYDTTQCESECEEDPESHYCTADLDYCFGNEVMGGLAIADHRIMTKVCDTDTGRWEPGEKFKAQCAYGFSPQKCAYGPDGQPMCVPCGKGTGRDCNEVDVRVAKDPNAKYGPAGDLLPGDLVSYTVTYENVGEGTAYGVYIEDTLSEVFDAATLAIGQDGFYLPISRTILWTIGELGPKGSPTASGAVTFTARLRDDLPGGTLVVNQGTVVFPSVPEETLTNQVVNVLWPVVGVPVSVTVQAGHSVPVTLTGRDLVDSPLTFAVVDPPARGTLTGTPPALTYAAPAGFAGQVRFTFTASNAITVSRPAAVTVLVVPDPADVTSPGVVWTVPGEGAVVAVPEVPAFTDTVGPVYTPFMLAGFDEAIDATTVTSATLRLTAEDGTPVSVTVSHSALTGEAIALLRRLLEPGTTYTVRATQGIQDLAGNPLAADAVWTFRTAGGGSIYLPLVIRSAP